MAGDLQALNTPTVPAVTLLSRASLALASAHSRATGANKNCWKRLNCRALRGSVGIADGMTES